MSVKTINFEQLQTSKVLCGLHLQLHVIWKTASYAQLAQRHIIY